MEREALKLALEALEEAHYKVEHKQDAAKREQAITAIREALAQPAQEQDWKTLPPKDAPLVQWVKEQTTTPQREWVDLSDSQIEQVYYDVVKLHRGAAMPWGQVQFGRALQALIKEKNT